MPPKLFRPDRAPESAAAPLDWPAYWFARLEEGLHRGEFDKAAAAAAELRRLGIVVTYPRPQIGQAVGVARG